MERANLLFSHDRLDLAEKELRAALAAEPQDAMAHALLSQCLSDRKQYSEATREAQEAVRLAPDLDVAHYALARGLLGRERLGEAEAAIKEALRLGPRDPDFHALLGWIRLGREDREGARRAAEAGLRVEPDHAGCANLRAHALVLLGWEGAAGAALQGVLARDPENAFGHANLGWLLLQQGDPPAAMGRFREALRLDPELDWAREGLTAALRQRHLVYRLTLLWGQWLDERREDMWTLAAPWWVVIPYVLFLHTLALLVSIARPLFNLALRLHPTGKWALSRDDMSASNWVGGCVLGGLAVGALGIGPTPLLTAVMLLLLARPVAVVFWFQAGRRRLAMAGYAGLMAGAALVSLILPGGSGEAGMPLLTLAVGFLVAFLLTDRVAQALGRV